MSDKDIRRRVTSSPNISILPEPADTPANIWTGWRTLSLLRTTKAAVDAGSRRTDQATLAAALQHSTWTQESPHLDEGPGISFKLHRCAV